jgi:hypothetical protein
MIWMMNSDRMVSSRAAPSASAERGLASPLSANPLITATKAAAASAGRRAPSADSAT